LFRCDPVPTEYWAYRLLKAQPIPNVPYLAVPWSVIINQNRWDLLLSVKPLPGGFTVCQHDYVEHILPWLERMGVRTLFTPNAAPACRNGILTLPFPHYPVHGTGPAHRKDIWFSFIGANTHPCRAAVFALPAGDAVTLKERSEWHFARDVFRGRNSAEQQKAEKDEYQDVLSRSRFSLCPRGVGGSSFRIWESLQAGAIPVLISDGLQLPFIRGVEWGACILRIAERDVPSIEAILRAVPREQEDRMRAACLEAHALVSGDNFVRCIRDFYHSTESLSAAFPASEQINIHCFFTTAYQVLVDEWFLPSVSEYKPVLMVGDGRGMTGAASYRDRHWGEITREKMDAIIAAIWQNWGRVFIFADPDIQFFRESWEGIAAALEGRDIVFQKDSPRGIACTGFFACRGNEKVLRFWLKARALHPDDQIAANRLLRRRDCDVRWGFLPDTFMSGGTLTGKLWAPGMALPLPEGMVLHHANWTIGLPNKLAQLRYVRDRLKGGGRHTA